MITLTTKNLPKIAKNHGLSQKELNLKNSPIEEYLENIHKKNQGFYEIIDDKTTIQEINKFAKKVEGQYKHIVVLGIGGSALGAICLQQSLKHLYENELPHPSCPRLHVIDNIDPALIQQLDDVIEYEKTLFIVISKSGTTVETSTQYFYFRSKIQKNGLDPKNHFVFITDPGKGLLREISEKEEIPAFEIPENVGGRFSVLTAVGLLPAKLIEIDIEKLIEGAQKMRDQFLSLDPEENLPFQLANIQYALDQKGKSISVLMPYSQRLIKLADWYRQLLAESIGKEGKGITPVNALGVTDQHSQSQLYADGPNDKLIIFIEPEIYFPELKIPNPFPDDSNYDFFDRGVTFNKLIQMEKKGTERALTEQDRPNITITIPQVSEETLGALFMLFEGSIAFLGEFYNINAFDQPGVELSKKITKELLAKEYDITTNT